MEGVTEVVELEEFRPQRNACTHVVLGGTTVIVMERSILTSGVESSAINQESHHQNVGAWEETPLLGLDKTLRDEVLAVVRHLSHIPLVNLLLEHVLQRGYQPCWCGVTPTGSCKRFLPWLET